MTVRRYLVAVALIGLGLLVVSSLVVALSASNSVPVTHAEDRTEPISPDVLKPDACAGITLTNKLSGSGVVAGTLANDWIIASNSIDTITGLAGDDCIEARGEADVIDGGPGTDVCLGGGGVDTFVGCETEIQ